MSELLSARAREGQRMCDADRTGPLCGGSGTSLYGCVLLCESATERVSDEAARPESGCMHAGCSDPVCCSACSLRHPSIPIADKMYWVDTGTAKIQRASLDGSNVEDLVASGLSYPDGIALDVAAGR